jgi:hypothetical protein
MQMRGRAVVGVVALVAALVGHAASAAPAGEADDRFDQITGPMGQYVVRPDAFGIDANNAMADVPSLLASVDGTRAFGVIEDLAFPRTATSPESSRVAARKVVTDGLTSAGYTVQQQSVVLGSTGVDSPNLFAELPGTECANRTIVIGAHYDSVDPVGFGSDDNASGIAGMLELARALRDHPLPVTVRFAAWSYEENGLVGSFAMAKDMKAKNRNVVGAISLEMIGFTKPDIDPLTGLPATYLAMVSDPTSGPMAKAFGAAAYTYTPEFPAFGAVIDPHVLPDILRSDHAAFLASGYPVLLVTDTANFRNPNYHKPTDTPGTIDQAFLKASIRSALAGLATLGSVDQDGDGHADACTRDLHAPASSTTTSTTSGSAATTAPGSVVQPAVAQPVPSSTGFTG